MSKPIQQDDLFSILNRLDQRVGRIEHSQFNQIYGTFIGGVNKIDNSRADVLFESPETAINQYTTYQSTIERSIARARSGDYSIKMTAGSGTDGWGFYRFPDYNESTVKVDGGETLTLSAYVWGDEVAPIAFELYSYNGTSTTTQGTFDNPTGFCTTDGWTRLSFTATIPDDTIELGYGFYFTSDSGGTTGDVVYFTDLQLEEGDVATAYAPKEPERLLPGSVTFYEIAAHTITADEIYARTITANQIRADTITANEIAANTITAGEIFAGTITAVEIMAGTITAVQIAANTITSNEIFANTITAADILAGTITTTEIAAATILGANVASATILSSHISVATLSALSANLGTITAGTVTGATLQTGTSGSRMVMSTTGLKGYDSLGGVIFDFKTADGTLTIAGTITGDAGSTMPAASITGLLTDAQLEAIAAAKITGKLVAEQLDVRIGGGNLFKNSSFETGITGWYGYRCDVVQSSTHAKFGTYSLRATSNTTDGEFHPYVGGPTSPISSPIETGKQYVFSAWIKPGSTARVVRMATEWHKANTDLISYDSDSSGDSDITEVSGAWTRVIWVATAPALATYALPFVQVWTPSSGEAHYIDGVQIEEGDVATAYAPKPDEILPGALADVQIGGGNLLTNSSFEASLSTGWTLSEFGGGGSSVTATQDATEKYHGSKSLKMVQTIGGEDDWYQQQVTTIKASHTYTLSAWVNVTSFVSAALSNRGLFVHDAVGNQTQTDITAATSGWVRHTVTLTAGASATYLEIRLYAPRGTIYWDAIQLEEGDVKTSYAPKPDEILPDTITATEIGPDSITTSELAANSVTSAKIVANTIIAADIAADTITASEIAANAITTTELNADAVTSAKIAANTIVAADIAANTITTTEIFANTILAADIAAGTITATEIAANTITAAKIAAGTITAVEISSGAITASKISVTAGALNLRNGQFNEGNPVSGSLLGNGWTALGGNAPTVVTSGTYGFKANIVNASPADSYFYQDITVALGRYVIKGWVQSIGVTGGAGQGAVINVEAGTAIGTFTDSAIFTGTTPFTEVQAVANITQAGTIRIYCQLGYNGSAQGTAEFANLSIVSSVGTTSIEPNSITTSLILANTILAGDIAAATITTNEIAALTIAAGNIAADAITASKILAGAVTATKIAANSITANHILAIGRSMIINGNFESGVEGWDIVYGSGTFTQQSAADAPDGDYVARMASGGIGYGYKAIPVIPGRVYYITITLKHSNGNGTMNWEMNSKADYPVGGYVTVANRDSSVGLLNINFPTTWTRYEQTWTCPAGNYWVTPSVTSASTTGTTDIDAVEMREASAGIIEGGTIRTAETGGRVTLDSTGLSVYGTATGNPLLASLPTAGTGNPYFAGKIFASGGAEFQGTATASANAAYKARWIQPVTGSELTGIYGTYPSYTGQSAQTASSALRVSAQGTASYTDLITATTNATHYWKGNSVTNDDNLLQSGVNLSTFGSAGGTAGLTSSLVPYSSGTSLRFIFSDKTGFATLSASTPTSFTFECWIRVDSYDTAAVLDTGLVTILNSPGTIIGGFFIDTSDKLKFSLTTSGGTYSRTDTVNVSTGSIYHLVGTWEATGNVLKFYKNKVQVGANVTTTGSTVSSFNRTYLNVQTSTTVAANDVTIDEIAIYQHASTNAGALSSSQITDHYDLGTTGVTSSTVVRESTILDSDYLSSYSMHKSAALKVPAVRVFSSSTTTVTNNTTTPILFNSERYDTENMHSTSSNTSRLTCVTAGVYVISGHVITGNFNHYAIILLNGTTQIAVAYFGTDGSSCLTHLTTQYNLAAGEYVEYCLKQISGGSIATNASAGNYHPEFQMHWASTGP